MEVRKKEWWLQGLEQGGGGGWKSACLEKGNTRGPGGDLFFILTVEEVDEDK